MANTLNIAKQGTVTPAGIVNFDPNTGKRLSQGQSVVVNPGNNTYGSLSVPTSNQVSTNTLTKGNTNTLTVPQTTSSVVPTVNAIHAGVATTLTPLENNLNPKNDYEKTLVNGSPAQGMESMSGLNQDVNTAQSKFDATQNEIQDLMEQLGYKANDRTRLENRYNIPGLTSQVADLKSQYASAKANFDTIAKQVGGQNIPSVFAGGQMALQQSIAATQLGGIATQIQVAQGNLDAAQNTIDRTISAKYDALAEQLDNKLKFYEINRDNLTSAQKKVADRQTLLLESQKSAIENKQKIELNVVNDIMDGIKNGKITATSGAKTISDIMNGKISIDTAMKSLASINVVGTSTGTYTPGANPVVDAWVKNIQSGASKISSVPANLKNAVSLALSQTTAQTAQNSGVLDALNLANQLAQNPKLGNITGVLGQYFGGIFGEAATAKNNYEQLKNFISVENRSKLKGQGAVSDFEAKMLAKAYTSLGRNLNETEFRKQLAIIKGTLTTASGGQADITITDPKTGQQKQGVGDRQTINDAIASGYLVDYN